ncbi:MAG TPA: energy transducer TonB [Thermoanaerobaculia bacterium]|nr:energy transducer TonB [Thermoanaerobaculia bacterium]
MFDDVLIESAGKDKQKGGWITALISAVVHVLVVGGIVAAGYYVKENPEVIQEPIRAFVQSAPPPPPPPPPPAASSTPSTPRKTTPRVEREVTPQETFRQPTKVPDEVPEVTADVTTDTGAVEGGVPGGVVGGQVGGVIGGVVGGVVGGVIGGELGGKLGGQLGGTGDMPRRVGGDVKPPVSITRVEPTYTEIARKARIEGIVIIEAIIDRNGNVTDARVLKPLPMGLDQAALEAVRRWKFRPGTLNGQPVPVIYNLTVNFRLQ